MFSLGPYWFWRFIGIISKTSKEKKTRMETLKRGQISSFVGDMSGGHKILQRPK